MERRYSLLGATPFDLLVYLDVALFVDLLPQTAPGSDYSVGRIPCVWCGRRRRWHGIGGRQHASTNALHQQTTNQGYRHFDDQSDGTNSHTPHHRVVQMLTKLCRQPLPPYSGDEPLEGRATGTTIARTDALCGPTLRAYAFDLVTHGVASPVLYTPRISVAPPA